MFLPTLKDYKDPVGACLVNSNIHFQILITKEYNIWDLKLYLEKDGTNNTILYLMNYERSDDYYNYFNLDLSINEVGLYFYCFVFNDVYGRHYISKDESLEAVLSDRKESWQLLIHDQFRGDLEWFKGKIMYQIMVDRFFDGGVKFVKDYAIMHKDWNELPIFKPTNGKVLNNDFFGGDLKGIIKKLDYLKSLNVSVILLNPIFNAYSNHKYDTSDFLEIDPMYGDENLFKELTQKAKEKGISIILDGVFNHTGSDSIYFNKEGRFSSVGAYQSKKSPYYSWYFFRKYPNDYESWWGFDTLPKVNQNEPSYIDFINGPNGVINKWIKFGARGFRLDVVDEYEDSFVLELNKAVKRDDDNNILLGEVWEDASNKVSYGEMRCYCTGDTLDSVMNYPIRDMSIAFIRGDIDAYAFVRRLESLRENYPLPFFYSLMNLMGSHDRPRILNMLCGETWESVDPLYRGTCALSAEQRALAVKRLRELWNLYTALPGMPCLYYGDEAGMEGAGDPFCRGTYPWGKEDKEILAFTRDALALRASRPVLRRGGFSIEGIAPDAVRIRRFVHAGCDAFGEALDDTDYEITIRTIR